MNCSLTSEKYESVFTDVFLMIVTVLEIFVSCLRVSVCSTSLVVLVSVVVFFVVLVVLSVVLLLLLLPGLGLPLAYLMPTDLTWSPVS